MTNKQSSAKTILKDIIVLIGFLGGHIIEMLSYFGILTGDIFMCISVALFVISIFVLLFMFPKTNPFKAEFCYEEGASWLQKYVCNYRLRLYILSALWLIYLHFFGRTYRYDIYDTLYQSLIIGVCVLIIFTGAIETILSIMRKQKGIYDPAVSDKNDMEKHIGFTLLRIGFIVGGLLVFCGGIMILIFK